MTTLKRLNMPKTWHIKRKGIKFITRPNPGRRFDLAMPVNLIIKDMLKYAKTNKEVRAILQTKNVLVDGKRKKDVKLPVGLFDSIDIENNYFRVIINKKGKIEVIKTSKDDAGIKPCKIIGKTKVKGKTQLNLYDGKNILVEKDTYKVGDTLIISLPKQDIKKHIKFEKNALVYLIGGKYIGEVGKIENITQDKITCKIDSGSTAETAKKYAFVIGDGKPAIILKNESHERS